MNHKRSARKFHYTPIPNGESYRPLLQSKICQVVQGQIWRSGGAVLQPAILICGHWAWLWGAHLRETHPIASSCNLLAAVSALATESVLIVISPQTDASY